jgi:arabinofuranosyltransferase
MSRRLPTLAVLLALFGFGALCWKAAWVSDDAYITLRVIDNLLAGQGLRWNIADRVQVFTHPLWLLVLLGPYALTRESLFTIASPGVALTLSAVVVMVTPMLRSGRAVRALVLVGILCGSRSVVSYATSGLENPLALLLLAAMLSREDRPRDRAEATIACTLASLIALTRMDLLLVAGPLALVRLAGLGRRDRLRAIAIGSLPFVAWEAFSAFYYGALVPNTAYAKLQTGVPRGELIRHGLRYFQSLGRWDPLGAAVLLAGVLVGVVRRRPIAIGLVAYGAYLVLIGGDFMAGRFFMIPIVLGAQLLCEAPWSRTSVACLATLPLLLLLADDQGQRGWLRGDGPAWQRWGVVDERIFYAAHTGLFHVDRASDPDQMYYSRFGRRLVGKPFVEESCIGMVGYWAGPTVHIIDAYGLPDPLLSRLPVRDLEHVRPGHFERALPPGYLATIHTGTNHIEDPDLAAYWDRLSLVVRGPLWSAARLRATVSLLLGRDEPLRRAYVARLAH